MDGPAEVGNLEVALHVEQEVLRLDITVDHLKQGNVEVISKIYSRIMYYKQKYHKTGTMIKGGTVMNL